MEDRRNFLLKVATGVAYSAPVIRTLASPPALLAQGSESETTQKGGQGMEMGMLVIQSPEPPTTTSTAPWAKKPGG